VALRRDDRIAVAPRAVAVQEVLFLAKFSMECSVGVIGIVCLMEMFPNFGLISSQISKNEITCLCWCDWIFVCNAADLTLFGAALVCSDYTWV
jgi:hypothetical protein